MRFVLIVDRAIYATFRTQRAADTAAMLLRRRGCDAYVLTYAS